MPVRYGIFFCLATCTLALRAQTFTTLHSFAPPDGINPAGSLLQAASGYLYGTTAGGGLNSAGTIYRITPNGSFTVMYKFCLANGCPDGYHPEAGMIAAPNGAFYGTASFGGANSTGVGGSVFRITPGGSFTALYSFCAVGNCVDGLAPMAPVVRAANGAFYGTTTDGGANRFGTVYRMTPAGVLTTLHSFCAESSCTDGAYPMAGLVQAGNGAFYGTTLQGGMPGSSSHGTIFRITPGGVFTSLYSFCSLSGCTDGSGPYAGLVLGGDGNLYGTTQGGGEFSGGTVFRMTPGGVLTTLYSFGSQPLDGTSPYAGLLHAADGNFYGTTYQGGVNNGGTVFQMTPAGVLTTLYNFCGRPNCADGTQPVASLVQAVNGDLYGTAYAGGLSQGGTIFRLSLGPAVPAGE